MDVLNENLEMQCEEKLAIGAIYGDSILQLDEHNSSSMQPVYILTINVDQDDSSPYHDITSPIQYNNNNNRIRSPRKMVLRLFFPNTYPSHDMPVFEMTSVYCGNTKVDSIMVDTIHRSLHALFYPGQVVLFEWIQWLEDYIRDHVEETTTTTTTTTTTAPLEMIKDDDNDLLPATVTAADADASDNGVPPIFSSEPLVDRKSIFVAHVAAVKNADQVKKVVSTLLENKKIARATHNIMAYRINLLGDNILQDNDDDGETAAGGRLMHLLQILDIKDVIVVVSRWFGGILLGPDRFKDINTCARQALEDCGYLQEGNKKRAKK